MFAYPSQCCIVLFKAPIKCNPFDFKEVLFIICCLLWFFNTIQLRTSCMWCMCVCVRVCASLCERERASLSVEYSSHQSELWYVHINHGRIKSLGDPEKTQLFPVGFINCQVPEHRTHSYRAWIWLILGGVPPLNCVCLQLSLTVLFFFRNSI